MAGTIYADIVLGKPPVHRVRLLDLAITPGGRVGDASPLGTKGGPRRLDDYVREVAHALMRKRGFTKSHAIATAKNALKRWRRGGGKVRPQVRAGAAAHLTIQEGLDKRRGTGHNLAIEHDVIAHQLLDLAWSDALHPRDPRGRFKSRGGKNTPRHKVRPPKDNRPDQRLARMTRLAQQEQARRIVYSRGLHRGPIGKVTSSRISSGEGKFRPSVSALHGAFSTEQRNFIELAQRTAADRDIDLGMNGARWKHGWIPLNAEAQRIAKARKAAGLAKGGAMPSGDLRKTATRVAAKRTLVKHTSGSSSRSIRSTQLAANKRKLNSANAEVSYRQHISHIDKVLNDPKLIERHDTSKTHARVNEHGETVFHRTRSAEQQKIVRQVLATQIKTGAKREHKALFLGGLPGAGKTGSLKKLPGLNPDDYVTINPDIFKEELAKRGMIPKISGLSPMEASGMVHEESTHMALMLATEARKRGLNIIWDITMNKAASVETRHAPLKEAGYKTHAVFVDIPHELSAQRVEDRHRRGYNAALRDRTGRHLGQRWVPSGYRGGGKSKTGSTSANRDAFDQVRNLFDGSVLYNNFNGNPNEFPLQELNRHGKFNP